MGSRTTACASWTGRIGTGAVVRVLIDTSNGEREWTTVGVSENIIEASWEALTDAYLFGLLHPREGAEGLFHPRRRQDADAVRGSRNMRARFGCLTGRLLVRDRQGGPRRLQMRSKRFLSSVH